MLSKNKLTKESKTLWKRFWESFNTTKMPNTFYDFTGDEVTLEKLVMLEPDWAVSQIRTLYEMLGRMDSQNQRLREWFINTTGLETDLLSKHMRYLLDSQTKLRLLIELWYLREEVNQLLDWMYFEEPTCVSANGWEEALGMCGCLTEEISKQFETAKEFFDASCGSD